MTESTPLQQATGSVRLHLLDGGSLATADEIIVHAGAPSKRFRLYDWCFLIHSEKLGRYILWDLGTSSDRSLYTPWVLSNQYGMTGAIGPRLSLSEQLKELGVDAGKIDTIVFSHAHWDHCRPFQADFQKAKAFFGPGTMDHCSPGHFADPDNVQWDGRFFDLKGQATENWEELKGPWQRFGPFDEAMDFLGDGSFWIINAPGHMPGNLAAAVRMQLEGSDQWVVLGGDCCHSRALLDGKAKIATFPLPNGGQGSLHTDIGAAEDTMQRLRLAERDLSMHIALAHDAEWMKAADDKVLMSLLGPQKRGEWLDKVKAGEQP